MDQLQEEIKKEGEIKMNELANHGLIEKTVRLPKRAWDVIEREAVKHGRPFDEEVRWLLTADFISEEKTERRQS